MASRQGTHGLSKHPLYTIWKGIHERCNTKGADDYINYGGRGIRYDPKWETFPGFLEDMGESYGKGLTIERIDNNSHYSRENCRWATRKEQANNTRNIERARRYTYNGQTKTIRQWAESIGIKRTTLDMRLRQYGWPLDRALEVYHR